MTIEGPTSQRVERKIARLLNCQDHPDLIVIAHNNLIVHIRGTGKESKDQTGDLSKLKATILKTMLIEVFGSRNIV